MTLPHRSVTLPAGGPPECPSPPTLVGAGSNGGTFGPDETLTALGLRRWHFRRMWALRLAGRRPRDLGEFGIALIDLSTPRIAIITRQPIERVATLPLWGPHDDMPFFPRATGSAAVDDD